ncbi:MAG TPA: DUF4247 domain-containing protein [Streptomyces sp.]|jgi:hypothetical protein|nr:DUF4247 domain-containing protein [Streptomyces sp.]
MKRIRPVVAVVALGLLATGCGENDVPSNWISQQYHYDGVSNGYLDRSDAPRKVADEIDAHTKAADRLSDGGMVFLRYDEDMVAVSRHGSGSLIEVEDYDDGYRRWGYHVRNRWPAPGSDSFRGGGPGSGK